MTPNTTSVSRRSWSQHSSCIRAVTNVKCEDICLRLCNQLSRAQYARATMQRYGKLRSRKMRCHRLTVRRCINLQVTI